MDNSILRLLASIGLFVVGALLVLAFAALLDRRVEHRLPAKRPSPWAGLICVLLGVWGAVVEYALYSSGVNGMICSALWGVLIVFGAIRLSKSISWKPGGQLKPSAEQNPRGPAGK